ncbi:MAG: RDD family protein [Oscillospiraceae bacterium]|nr:RDD family protein [Oscillospiraceae bacterium]
MSDRFKRIAAFLIDWNPSFLPSVIIAFFLKDMIGQPQAPVVFLFLLLILAPFAAVLLRDVPRGRSIGKRIMKLYVCDQTTMEIPATGRRIKRSLFFFLYPIDTVLLLVTGQTIGDRVAHTAVLSASAMEERRQSPVAKHKTRRTVITILAIVLLFMIILICAVFLLLEAQKDTPEYKLAYDYLVSSEAFRDQGADPAQIVFNQYSSSTSTSNGVQTRTLTYGFLAAGHSYQVILHEVDGTWQICEECTTFQGSSERYSGKHQTAPSPKMLTSVA